MRLLIYSPLLLFYKYKEKVGQQKKNETEVKGERKRRGENAEKRREKDKNKKSEQFWEKNIKPR